jgi:hypothetical protein
MKNLSQIFISAIFLFMAVACEKDIQKEDDQDLQMKSTLTDVCSDETGWADGARYLKKGNWATFVQTPPYDSLGVNGKHIAPTVELTAGQYMEAGTIYFYKGPEEGTVRIKIRLLPCVSLQIVDEAIKIQGYDVNPTGIKPVPGQFITYKGNGTFNTVDGYYYVDVPYFKYYGIHVDLYYCCN